MKEVQNADTSVLLGRETLMGDNTWANIRAAIEEISLRDHLICRSSPYATTKLKHYGLASKGEEAFLWSVKACFPGVVEYKGAEMERVVGRGSIFMNVVGGWEWGPRE